MSGKKRTFSFGKKQSSSESSRIVKYSKDGDKDDDELEDISIVSNADLGQVTYGGGQGGGGSNLNGPRLVPGKERKTCV